MGIFSVLNHQENQDGKNQPQKKYRKRDKEIEDLENEIRELTQKYMALLEEKAEGFNQYLYYHDKYAEAYNQLKEQKKEMANLKIELKEANKTVDELTKEVEEDGDEEEFL